MSLYRDEGVVLRVQKLGEADRIVTVLTRQHGRVRAVAKGVRRTRSRFGATVEPFSHVDLQLWEGRGGLDTVTQAESITSYGSALVGDYARYTSGTAVLETAERLTAEEREPSLRLFLLVVGALRRGWARARRREVPVDTLDVDRRGAFLVGLLHGTGAETPTQVVLFASAGAAGSTGAAVIILGAFIAGLVVADLGIAAAWLSGVLSTRRAPSLQLGLGVVTGVASLTLGLLILTGYSGIVPPLVTE